MAEKFVSVDRTCPVCGKPSHVDVPIAAWEALEDGAHIQHAWPNGTPEEREILHTGIHGECWEKMFGEDEK